MRQRGKAARREHDAAVAYAAAAETSSPKSRGSSRDLTDQMHGRASALVAEAAALEEAAAPPRW